MDEERIVVAIRAARRIARVYRHPETAPEWSEIRSDLVDAKSFYESLPYKTADQAVNYYHVCSALLPSQQGRE